MARLLIADDATAIVDVLLRFLTRQGYAVEAVHDGASALVRMRTGAIPDLLIADLTMPILGGRELVREMRADVRLRAVPVVLMSGAVPTKGALPPQGDYQACIGKPFALQELLSAVQAALGESG